MRRPPLGHRAVVAGMTAERALGALYGTPARATRLGAAVPAAAWPLPRHRAVIALLAPKAIQGRSQCDAAPVGLRDALELLIADDGRAADDGLLPRLHRSVSGNASNDSGSSKKSSSPRPSNGSGSPFDSARRR